jgi:imidazolonepropionase
VDGFLLTGIGHLTTNVGPAITDAVVAIDGIRVSYAGSAGSAPEVEGRKVINCEGGAVLPGFVDAHTHVVFAGDRSAEFAKRLAGVSYADIAAEGGGILSTVASTRDASEDELFALASKRIWRMIGAGTTTIEIKSGYGLDPETEMRILRVARRLGQELPVKTKTTFLGAHSVPAEFKGRRDDYVQLIIAEMLPAAAPFADYCDVFIEEGAFDIDEGRAIFDAAAALGLGARVHAEQLAHSGGAMLAADIGAASADHLDHATLEDARALAEAGVAAVLVPGASYTLRSGQAPGPMLWDAGCTVALATDCNPGTSYFEAMAPIISLGVVQMGLTTEQAIWSATRGGALSLGLDDLGVITPGAPADLIVLDAPSPAHIPYRPGANLVRRVFSSGKSVLGVR